MRTILLISLLFLCFLSARSQDKISDKVIGIHPAVGKTIDRNEMVIYRLFPGYNEMFDSAVVIKHIDSTLSITFYAANGSRSTQPLSATQLGSLCYSINDVEKRKNDKYYAALQQEQKEVSKEQNEINRKRHKYSFAQPSYLPNYGNFTLSPSFKNILAGAK